MVKETPDESANSKDFKFTVAGRDRTFKLWHYGSIICPQKADNGINDHGRPLINGIIGKTELMCFDELEPLLKKYQRIGCFTMRIQSIDGRT